MRSFAIAMLMLSLCILFSCQKKFEDPNIIPTTGTADFRAKINGAPFVAVLTGAAIRDDSVISIAAESNDKQMIVFAVKDSGVHIFRVCTMEHYMK